MNKILSGGMALAFLTLLSACGGGEGTAKLAFANAADARSFASVSPVHSLASLSALRATAAPTAFQMKLIAAYVTADIDPVTQNNTGMTAMIFLNSDCQDDISHCDISGGDAEDGTPMSKIVTSYFDFAQTSTAVNTALNAQARAITAGTYKYARLEFCKYNNEDAKNIKWADGTTVPTGTPQEFQRNSCTVNSTVFDPPIVVTAGGSLTVTLTYDLSAAISDDPSCTGDDSAGTGGSKRCFTMPTFVPSAL